MDTAALEHLDCAFYSKSLLVFHSKAMRQYNAIPVTQLTISAFCCQLRPALLQALPQFTLLFSQSVSICCHFNCLTLADLTLLPGRHSVTLNDEKRQDEDKTEGVSERRDETRRVRGGWGSASLRKKKGGLMK